MKILWLLPILPYPPDSGGKQDPYYMIRECSRAGDEITAGIIYHDKKPPHVPPEFAKLVKEVHWLKGNPKNLAGQLFASLSDPIPFKFKKYYHNDSVKVLVEMLSSSECFDVVIIDHLHLSPLALDAREILVDSKKPTTPYVLRTPNVESKIVVKYAERMDNPVVKTFADNEAKKMKKFEAAVLPEFEIVAAISPVDAETFRAMALGPSNIICITAGVDVDEMKKSGRTPVDGEVVFVGSFDWHPNVDGAIWMIDNVWPKILAAYPRAHLSLVGREPPPPLLAKASQSITLTGTVESVAEYVDNAECVAIPLLIGSGMRLKILEAFAFSKPVVSTRLGAEGIDAVDGRHIILSDNPDEFANSVLSVLNDPKLADKLGSNARSLVEEKYSWKTVTAGLRKAIGDLISK